ISTSDQQCFTSPGQHHWSSGLINGPTCPTDAVNCQLFFVERRCAISSVVLDRQAGRALGDAEICICGYHFGLVGESVQKISIDRQCRCGRTFTDVPEHFVEGYATVGLVAGKG